MSRGAAAVRRAAWIALVLATRLATAPSTVAQEAPDAVVPPRVEIGGGAGLTWYLPTATVVASVPVASWLAVEGSLSRFPGHLVAQAQARVPFAARRRSRRSLIVGLSHASGGQFLEPGAGLHLGASFQEPVTRHMDLRLDVQQMLPLRDGPDAVPRAMVLFVWHR